MQRISEDDVGACNLRYKLPERQLDPLFRFPIVIGEAETVADSERKNVRNETISALLAQSRSILRSWLARSEAPLSVKLMPRKNPG